MATAGLVGSLSSTEGLLKRERERARERSSSNMEFGRESRNKEVDLKRTHATHKPITETPQTGLPYRLTATSRNSSP